MSPETVDSWSPTAPTPLDAMANPLTRPVRNMADLHEWLNTNRAEPVVSLRHSLLDLHLLDPAEWPPGMRASEAEQHLLATQAVSEWDLEHARAHMLHTPLVDAEAFVVESQALQKCPWSLARKHHIIPLGVADGQLYIATHMPFNRDLRALLALVTDCPVSLVWSGATQIAHRLARETHSQEVSTGPTSGTGSPGDSGSKDVHALLSEALSEIQSTHDQEVANEVEQSSSVIQLVNRMILDAYEQKASDIHIETNPGEDASRIRFRKDGDLEEYLNLPVSLRAAMVSRIKIMSRLDISERRRPQDGKINFHEFANIQLELRVAVLPTHDNLEDVVMRLLATSKPIPMPLLGLSARDTDIMQRLCERQFGLILACGPTGSGKTTTLHSLLAHINTDNRKIWTAEDPIEITQSGLRQLQVNPKIGVTFASAMRAFLRADPDVIMIGEVRDPETAAVCIEASLTGHLVFSTLHTNSAAESVIRLLDLGMDPLNFGDSLIGIIAQRLVRALCRHCAIPAPTTADTLQSLVEEYVQGSTLSVEEGSRRLLAAIPTDNAAPALRIYQPVGCKQCGGRGYKGRIGVYELLENAGDMKRLIQARAPTAEIFAQASRAGMRTLRQDALEKVVCGQIDLAQARTVY